MFTGHSLGGGLATLAAVDVALKFNVESELYTFGQVRVGNQAYADYVEGLISKRLRFTNRRDLVPQLPPRFLQFRHFGPEVRITIYYVYLSISI